MTTVVEPTRAPPSEAGHSLATTARVTRVEGAGASVSAGAVLQSGDVMNSGEARVVCDFEAGGRFELEAGSSVKMGEFAPQDVVLASGIVRGRLPPSGNSPRPPLRLATTAGVVVIPGSGDVLVASLPGGRAWVAVLGGSVRVMIGDADEQGRVAAITLVAGQAMALTPTPAEPTDAPATLADARALAARLIRATDIADDEATSCEPIQQALAQMLASHRALVARGEALRERQRSLARRDPARARGLLGSLVDHSRSLIRSKDRLRVLAERASALAEGGCPTTLEQARALELLRH